MNDPLSYCGIDVTKKFGRVPYKGKILGYSDQKQWWQIKFDDGDCEDWSVPDMKKWVPSFVCGPVLTASRSGPQMPCERGHATDGEEAEQTPSKLWLRKWPRL